MTKILEEAGYNQEEYNKDMAEVDVEEKVGFIIPLDYQLTEDGLTVQYGTDKIEMSVTFAVPERETEYRLDICLAGTKDVLVSKMIAPGTSSIYELMHGRGLVAYDLYVDGTFLKTTKPIEFTKEG